MYKQFCCVFLFYICGELIIHTGLVNIPAAQGDVSWRLWGLSLVHEALDMSMAVMFGYIFRVREHSPYFNVLREGSVQQAEVIPMIESLRTEPYNLNLDMATLGGPHLADWQEGQ